MYRNSKAVLEHDATMSTCAVVMGALCFFLSWGALSVSVGVLIKFVGLSLLLVGGPSFIHGFCPKVSRPFASLSLWVLLIITGLLPDPVCAVAGGILAVLGGGVFLWCSIQFFANTSVLRMCRVLFLAGCCSLLLPLFAWQSGDGDPLISYSLVNGGFPVHDHVFHAAIASMIQSHGVCSSGLDGVVYVPYHCGSHFAAAIISNLAGCLPLDYYALGYPIVMLPFCLWATLESVSTIARAYRPGSPLHEVSLSGYLVIFVGLSGFLYDILWPAAHSRWDLYLRVSESQMVGVTLVLIVIAAFVQPLNELFFQPELGLFSLKQKAIALSVWAAFVWVTTVTKTSNGHLLFVAVSVATLLAMHRRRFLLVASLVCGFVVTLVTVLMITGGESGLVIAPLVFAQKSFLSKDWWQYWFLSGLPLLVFFLLRVQLAGIRTSSELFSAARSRRCFDLWLLPGLFLASVVPCLVFAGANASITIFYQGCVHVCLICGIAALLTAGAMVSETDTMQLRDLQLTRVVSFLICLALAAGVADHLGRNVFTIAKANINSRGDAFMTPLGAPNVPGKPGLRDLLLAGDFSKAVQLLRANTDATELLFQTGRGAVIRELQNLGRRPSRECVRTALWIPKENRDFWDISTETRCRPFIPVLAVALSGLPLIDGYPEVNEQRGYGFVVYPYGSKTLAESRSCEEVLERATDLGFVELIELRSGGQITLHQLTGAAASVK